MRLFDTAFGDAAQRDPQNPEPRTPTPTTRLHKTITGAGVDIQVGTGYRGVL